MSVMTKAEARSEKFYMPSASWITVNQYDYSFYFSGSNLDEVLKKIDDASIDIEASLIALRTKVLEAKQNV